MDRTKRWTLEENHLWSNPCDYKNVDKVPVVEYKPKIAENIAALASNERYNAESYRHEFAQVLHSYSRFEELLPIWDNTEWLRKFPWFEDRVLPAAKKFGHPMPQEYISALMKNIDEVLPVQYKAVKMIVAAFHNITRESLNEHVASYLKSKMTQSMHSVRAILCAFNELLQSRKLPILKIDATEIPTFGSDNNSAVTMLLVYRDMLNMMHYLAQEFEAMSKMT